MAHNFRPVNRDQLYLLPPSLRDWLPEGHLAWFLIDAVDQMDLRLCHEAGLLKVGTVNVDGTKMKANASLEANRTYEQIRREVEKMLGEAEQTDREEDERYGPGKRGNGLPEELRNRQSRLERLRACKQRLEQEAAQRAARRGLAACDSEWKLIALTHNLLKLWRWVTGRLQIAMRPQRALVATV